MFFRYVGEAKMSKPMKSAAQLSLVVTSYMARLHGNDDISGIGKNASSPIDSLDLGVPSIARCPLPSFHRWTMLAALPPLSRYGSGVPPPSFCGSIHPGRFRHQQQHPYLHLVQTCKKARTDLHRLCKSACPNGHFSGLARFVGPINLCLLKRERGRGGAWEAHAQTSRIGHRGRCQPTRT